MLFEKIGGTESEIEAEISECRQDERDSQNQILQVIAAAGTVLSVIFGSSALFPDDDIEQRIKMLQILFRLNVTVFCAALPYVTTLGIANILRFQYIRALEDNLAKKCPNSALLRWMSFSSPITTRNLLHIASPVTLFHFCCYNIATFSAILFCLILTYAQYLQIPQKSLLDSILLFFSFSLMLIFALIFIFTCLNAEKIADFCMKKATERRTVRLNKSNSHNLEAFIKYALYPRAKDFQKGMLIILGYVMGMLLFPRKFSVEDFRCVFVNWFVIEYLAYQARYQVNDLRGLHEEQSNRLPMPMKFASASALIALFRLLTAVFIIALLGKGQRLSLI